MPSDHQVGIGSSPFRRVRVGDVMTLDRTMFEVDPDAKYVSVGVKSYGEGVFHYPPRRGSDLGKLNYFQVRPGALLVSNIMAWEGAVGISTASDAECVASSRFLPYFPDRSQADLEYLKYFFSTGPGHILIRWASTGTAKRNRTLGIERFERLEFPLPPLPEQKKIAAILSSVDEAIQATQAVIEQTRRVKEGLLQDLLTRGIGHTRFKQTEIGEIPASWEVRRLRSLLSGGVRNGLSPQTADSGVPTFSIAAVKDGLVDIFGNLKHADVEPYTAERFRVRSGDLLLIRGNGNPALVGTAGIVDEHPEGCIYPDILMRLTPGENTRAGFLLFAINSQAFHRRLLRKAATTNGTWKVNGKTVGNMLLAVPPKPEQAEIEQRLNSVGQSLKASATALQQLQNVKAGLLQDLLTGKVRVSV